MNRRGFFKTLAAATAGFYILPTATTYERVWKAARKPIYVGYTVITYPIWDPPFDPKKYYGEWHWLTLDGKVYEDPIPKLAEKAREERS